MTPASDHSHRADLADLPAPMRAKRLLRAVATPGVRYRLRTRLLDTPVLSEAFVAADPAMRRNHRVMRSTRIVLDGFPRSANSYARAAFEYANGRIGVCSHMHSHRAVQLGVRHSIPTIVLIREPRGVIASSIQYTDGVPPIAGIRNYVRFYEHVIPLADRVVVSDFPDTIADFGAVIERANALYGTSFARYEPTPDAEAAVNAEIDEWTRALVADDRVDFAFARPTDARRHADEVLGGLDARSARALDEASCVYEALVSLTARR